MDIKITTMQCDNIKVTTGHYVETDRLTSVRLDIGNITAVDLKQAVKILQGLIALESKNSE